MEKGPDAFRTISEVADDLDLPQHVLRFWETRFAQIKPMKRGGGRRYYRPDDVDLLRGIRHLLYGEGYTIRGVQQILKDQGLRYVQTIGRSAETDPTRLRDINFDQEALEADAENLSVSAGARGGVVSFVAPPRPRAEPEMPRQEMPRTLEPRIVEVPREQPREASREVPRELPRQAPPQHEYEDDGPAIPFRKFAPAPEREEPRVQMRSAPDERYEPRAAQDERYEPRQIEPQIRAPVPRAAMPEAPGSLRLPAEAVRLLKATLYELGECRRLDQLGDFPPSGQDRLHRQTGGGAQFVERIQVEGVARGHHQRAVVPANRKQGLAVNQPRRKGAQQRQVNFRFRQIDVVQSHFLTDGTQRGFLAHQSQFDRGLVDARSFDLATARQSQLSFVEQPMLEKNLARVHSYPSSAT